MSQADDKNAEVKNSMFGIQPVEYPLGSDQLSDVSSIPKEPSPVDIIFVHGLGGSAKGTWTHPDTKGFWPSWLFQLQGMKNVRIFTFGYDSGWEKIWKPRNYLGIQEFARQLIDCLDLHYKKDGNVCLHPSVLIK